MSAKYKTQFANGNIKTLNRNMDLGDAQAIDQLSYTYSGNQILAVDDALGANYEDYGFKDNGYFEQEEYFYDKNGNLYKDLNKGIIDINYNHFNLPKHIRFGQNTTETKRIEYTYTADGSKLRKQTVIGETDAIKTDYLDSFIYENDEISFIQTSEGRLVPNDNGEFDYEYTLKDHLGNTRVMFSQTGEILQDESYYPFGMSLGNALTYNNTDDSPANKYLYNGKELQGDFGLDWYDYGARFYDVQLGRWHVVDPLAHLYYNWSTNNYTLNNPLRYIDPDGKASGDPPYMYATEGAKKNGEVIYNVYNELPKDVKRTVNGVAKIGFGLAQFLGGFLFATVTSPTVVGGVAGGATAMVGAYKVGEGIHQIANVLSGTSDEQDPKYSTPVGAITESETIDNIVDLATGGTTSSAGNTVLTTINSVSTVNSGANLVIEASSNQKQQNIEESDTKKAVDNSEKKINDDNISK